MTLVERETQDTGASAGELCLGLATGWRLDWPDVPQDASELQSWRRILESGAWPTGQCGLATRESSRVHVTRAAAGPASWACLCLDRRLGWERREASNSSQLAPPPFPSPHSPAPLRLPNGDWLAAPLAHFLPSSSLRSKSPQIASYQEVVSFLPSTRGPQVPV